MKKLVQSLSRSFGVEASYSGKKKTMFINGKGKTVAVNAILETYPSLPFAIK